MENMMENASQEEAKAPIEMGECARKIKECSKRIYFDEVYDGVIYSAAICWIILGDYLQSGSLNYWYLIFPGIVINIFIARYVYYLVKISSLCSNSFRDSVERMKDYVNRESKILRQEFIPIHILLGISLVLSGLFLLILQEINLAVIFLFTSPVLLQLLFNWFKTPRIAKQKEMLEDLQQRLSGVIFETTERWWSR